MSRNSQTRFCAPLRTLSAPCKLASHDVFGRRKDEGFLKLKALLKPFGITRYDRTTRALKDVVSKPMRAGWAAPHPEDRADTLT